MFKQSPFDDSHANENWLQWKPNTNIALPIKYKVESICDIIGVFYIVLAETQNEKNKIKIIYEQSVESYRRTNLLIMKKYLAKHICNYSSALSSYYKVENSEYALWLSNESFGAIETSELIHLVFVGDNWIVDVVSCYEPKIMIME